MFVEAFVLTFLAEWGDRSQIATIGEQVSPKAAAVLDSRYSNVWCCSSSERTYWATRSHGTQRHGAALCTLQGWRRP